MKKVLKLLENRPSTEEFDDSIAITLKVRGDYLSLLALVRHIKEIEKECEEYDLRSIRKESP
jgi:hypothetical protein